MSVLDDITTLVNELGADALIQEIQGLGGTMPDAGGVTLPQFDLGSPYDSVGEVGASPLDTARCCSDKICTCLGGAIRSIAYSQAKIAALMDDYLNRPCKNIEQCMDKIVDALRKKFERPLASCEECQQMAQQGLGGTFEYVFACAGVTCKECETVCSLGDTSTEGKCCKACGKPQGQCHCKGGICTEDEEKEQPKKKYQGWCNPDTGVVLVTPQDQPAPGLGFVPAAIADTEQVALEESTQYCQRNQQQTAPPPPISNIQSPGTICSVSDYVSGYRGVKIGSNAGELFKLAGQAQAAQWATNIGVEGITLGNLAFALGGAMQSFAETPGLAPSWFVPQVVPIIGCQDSGAAEVLEVIGALSAIEKFTGISLLKYAPQYDYTVHSLCRQSQLTPEQATAAYLANVITPQQLDAHWAIAGFCPDAVNWNLYATRAKPVPLQLAVMRHREIITPQQYADGMRQLGYLEPVVAEDLFTATYQIPTMSDILRFMVRDADDEDLVARFGLDAYFTDKYRSQLKKWSKDQGVPEQAARYAWRAHWNIPAPTQLFEFWHRRRTSDRPGGAPKLLDDIKAALIQQDILPYWHDDYLAVSYRPLTRIDVRRAYNIGSLTDDEVVDAYIQLGYSDETAATLAKFSKRLRDLAIPGNRNVKLWLRFAIDKGTARDRMVADGLPGDEVDKALLDVEQEFKSSLPAQAFVKGTINRQRFIDILVNHGVSADGANKLADNLALKIVSHPAVKEYIVGVTTRSDARSDMQQRGMDDGVIDYLLDESDRAIRTQQVLNCQRGIKRKYLMGELDKGQATGELQSTGTSGERASQLVNSWDCERSSNGRAVAASKLCDWLARGAINSQDFIKRLVNIGYREETAALMLDDCLISINAKRLAQAKAEAKQQAIQQRRAAQAIRQAAAAEQRQADQLAAASRRAAATKARRDSQLLSAIGKVHKACDCPLDTITPFIKDAKSRIMRDYALDTDQALQALIRSADEWAGGDISTLTPVINEMSQAIVGEFSDSQQ